MIFISCRPLARLRDYVGEVGFSLFSLLWVSRESTPSAGFLWIWISGEFHFPLVLGQSLLFVCRFGRIGGWLCRSCISTPPFRTQRSYFAFSHFHLCTVVFGSFPHSHPFLGKRNSCGGSSRKWTRDLLHPKQVSYSGLTKQKCTWFVFSYLMHFIIGYYEHQSQELVDGLIICWWRILLFSNKMIYWPFFSYCYLNYLYHQ